MKRDWLSIANKAFDSFVLISDDCNSEYVWLNIFDTILVFFDSDNT